MSLPTHRTSSQHRTPSHSVLRQKRPCGSRRRSSNQDVMTPSTDATRIHEPETDMQKGTLWVGRKTLPRSGTGRLRPLQCMMCAGSFSTSSSRKRRKRPQSDGGPIKDDFVSALPGGWDDVRGDIRKKAQALGLTRARFTSTEPPARLELYKEWVKEGKHGEMGWLAKEDRVARRADLELILPGVKSVLCFFTSYWPGKKGFPDSQLDSRNGVISCYAWGKDYHDIIGARLDELCKWMHEEYGGSGRWYVDTGPVMERDFAERAGLGYVGKHTLVINEQLGSGGFLAEMLTTLPLPPDPPRKKTGGCGRCTRCIVGCPTGAIDAQGYKLDGRKCVSYLTIEHKGAIPLELRPRMGNLIYGCDICQKVCPWNRFSWPGEAVSPLFGRVGADIMSPSLAELLRLRTDEAFAKRFQGSAIRRIGRSRMLRNVAVAIGNSGDPALLSVLREAMDVEKDALILEHVAWAIERLEDVQRQTEGVGESAGVCRSGEDGDGGADRSGEAEETDVMEGQGQ